MAPSDTDHSASSLQDAEGEADGTCRSDDTGQINLVDRFIEFFKRFQVGEDATQKDHLRAMAKMLPIVTVVLVVIAGGTFVSALTLQKYLFVLGTQYFGTSPFIAYVVFCTHLVALIYVLYGETSKETIPYRWFVGGAVGTVITALPIVLTGLSLHNPISSVSTLVSTILLLVIGGTLLWWSRRQYRTTEPE